MLQDLLSALVTRGARLMDQRAEAKTAADLELLCDALLSSRGEASGVALAAQILDGFSTLDETERATFFAMLTERFDPDPARAILAAQDFAQERSARTLGELIAASEPPRQELMRRLNLAPGGTAALVGMREALLSYLGEHPEFARLDADFQHLFQSWFNRGFLVLRPIDWASPAHILDKIIAYEAVHEIGNWDELRRRLRPADRRCFGFFHPSMPDEPLIFVEVALTQAIPDSIQDLLADDREILSPDKATTAVFYSISNCQQGLRGVSFGSFLIKQVAQDLTREIPALKTFVTLSPAPGFIRWLKGVAADGAEDSQAARALDAIAEPLWHLDEAKADAARELLLPLAAEYFLAAKRPDGQPVDAVARFHLGNGATLRQINWLGDTSPKGFAQSAGIMVNYLYDLAEVEANHEAYAARREVKAAKPVRGLLRTSEKRAARKDTV
ncbi:malonyl-CoA decarboxylase [Breoghania sp. L-A4]|uniref:malonyl-CoA decarboxylase n=1 Tax=Breoghania sp. L-A4 TaxID=2304600 RepID=UPI000E35B11D|nr:malonyl-CoA decarboxylase [Breoghania sp. L-A4]AXS39336.1 MCD, Malonyl-CoA decarboxylase MCD [Breoghania sp. L-A4]